MVIVYVEGGGKNSPTQNACRRGFQLFLEKAGFRGRMPQIIACGGRSDAYKSFCKASKNGESAFLLVDSEASISEDASVWQFLRESKLDKRADTSAVSQDACHLMVECMENWFLTDQESLKSFFGKKFQSQYLPVLGSSVESIAKDKAQECLAKATKDCAKKYMKGALSFQILARIDHAKVVALSPRAKQFIESLSNVMSKAVRA